jgi:ADP-L-glycero-D-manno-heptose 6-epimerase
MYVVTGGAGFIGSAFVSKLNSEGINDILIVDNLGKSPKWLNLLGKKYIDYIHRDHLFELLASKKYHGTISAIIHMGACSSTTEEDCDYLMKNNFHYSQQLAEYCYDNSIRFIYASSAAVYGNGERGYSDEDHLTDTFRPLNRYGYSKQIFDQWVIKNQHTDRCAGLRFFNVYGPNEYHKGPMRSVIHKAFHQVQESGEITLFRSYRNDYADGAQQRDFVYVKDCVDVLWWLTNHQQANGIFNVGTGSARSWNELANAVFTALGKEPNIRYIDMPAELIMQYQYFTEANLAKLCASECPVPLISLEDGVKDYVQNYLSNGSFL